MFVTGYGPSMSLTEQSRPPATSADPSLAELVQRLTRQTSALVRDEVRLAQAEMAQKAKRGGIGAGLLGAGGVLTFYAIGCLVAGAVLALDLVLPTWAAALCTAGGLLLLTGILSFAGVQQAKRAVPPVPTEALANVKRDVLAVRR
jgi:hypothetical protein